MTSARVRQPFIVEQLRCKTLAYTCSQYSAIVSGHNRSFAIGRLILQLVTIGFSMAFFAAMIAFAFELAASAFLRLATIGFGLLLIAELLWLLAGLMVQSRRLVVIDSQFAHAFGHHLFLH